MQVSVSVLVVCVLGIVGLAQTSSIPAPPATPKQPVTDMYHGVKVTEDYRWLENWDDPAVKQWSAAENSRTREYLDHLPARAAIQERLKEMMAATSRFFDVQYRGGTLFAMRFASKQQAYLIALRSANDVAGEKVVVDPNTVTGAGSVSIDFYRPSLDGKLVAVSLSSGGSEDGTAHVFEVASGKELPDQVPHVNFATAGGSIAWNKEGTGFYYTRYPRGNERAAEDAHFYQQVYFHKLGADASQDVYIIGKEFPRIAEIRLQTSDDGKWMLASVGNGDGGEFAHYLMDASNQWKQVTHFDDHVASAEMGATGDPSLYLLSRKDAPLGKVLRLPLSNPDLTRAKLLWAENASAKPEDRATIDSICPTKNRLIVSELAGGPYRIRILDHEGRAKGMLPLPEIASVNEVLLGGADTVLYEVSTYLEPTAWYSYNEASGKSERTAMIATSPVNFDDAEVVREFAVSKDGTRIPMNIIRRKGTKLDGSNPTLLRAYGGYNISVSPSFAGATGRMWLDQGGVYVSANLRGGGEYGEDWHRAGNLTHKQNVFDDFIASAKYLIESRYTSPEHLAILGGSNGGLLMGAVLTQRPELFRAVVSSVGIYDMLRVELDPNGTFNITEFGTVKDPDQFKALYAYSPYHHVQDGVAYPAVLFVTGENDHRVNPMNSRKMTARLQAANPSGMPVLLRTSSGTGHGFGTALDARVAESTDILSFLFDQLGVRYQAPATK